MPIAPRYPSAIVLAGFDTSVYLLLVPDHEEGIAGEPLQVAPQIGDDLPERRPLRPRKPVISFQRHRTHQCHKLLGLFDQQFDTGILKPAHLGRSVQGGNLVTINVSLHGRLIGHCPKSLVKGPISKTRPLVLLGPLALRIASRLDVAVNIHKARLCVEGREPISRKHPHTAWPAVLRLLK